MFGKLRSDRIRAYAAQINALYHAGHVKEAAILCAQVSPSLRRRRDLTQYLKFRETTFSKLVAIGEKCLTCWSRSLRAKLKDQIELLYECTFHEVSVLEEAVETEEFRDKMQKNALHYLRQKRQ
jgi:hypothetical protein